MRCTEVADRPFADGKFTCRDIGDRWRYLEELARIDSLERRHLHLPTFTRRNWI